MRKHLWFSLIASLCVQGAIGQTDRLSGRVAKRQSKKISTTWP